MAADAARERVAELLARARDGRSGVLVVSGSRGSARSALLSWAAAESGDLLVLPVVGRQAERDLPYAGLYDLLRPVLAELDRLPPQQAAALRAALALGPSTGSPDRFAPAVATLTLLALLAEARPVVLLVDDADRLDPETASCLGFVLRRLEYEGIAVLLATQDDLPPVLELPDAERVELADVAEDLDRLLAQLPERTRRALEVVATGECDSLGALMRALDADRLGLADLEPAEQAGLLTTDAGQPQLAGGVRTAVLASARSDRVGRLHTLLAAEADGARAPQERARHLLAIADAPDAAVADAVEQALPDPVHSARAMRRVAELTPPGSLRDKRLRAAAEAALTAGHVPEAMELVGQGLRTIGHPVERAKLVHLRGRMALWGGPELATAAAELVEEAERVIGDDPALAGTMLADAGLLRCYAREVSTAVALAERAVALTGTDAGLPHDLARTTLGVTLVLSDRIIEARPHLERYSALLQADVALFDAAQMLQHVVIALAAVERYADSAGAAARFIATARSLSAVGLLPMPLCLLANSAWWAGDWDRAQLAAAEARALAIGTGQPALELYSVAMLALVAASRGQEERCRSWMAQSYALCEQTGLETFRPTTDLAGALLELGLGRPRAALVPLRRLQAMFAGQPGQGGLMHWRADLVTALWQAGDHEEARAELAAAQHDLAHSESPWERAALLRCRGLVGDDPEQALADLAASVAGMAGYQPFEEARSRFRLAERLDREGREGARQQAGQAAALFAELGAAGWLRQVQALLPDAPAAAAGEQPLTDLERRLVLSLAEGDTVEQAAARFFLAPQTVRAHLAELRLRAGVDDAGLPALAGRRPRPRNDLPAPVVVRLLGGFSVDRDGEPVTIPAGVGMQAVKLVAVRGGRVTVDELVDALWPDAEQGRGRTRLRNVLNRLRRDGGELLLRDGDEVVLPPGTAVDAHRFAVAAEAVIRGDGDAAAAADLYTGELLPADRYEDWTSGPRERLRGRYLALLDRLTAEAGAAGDADGAMTWFERAVAVEPYDEERYVALARLLLAADRRGAALRVVRRATAMLADLDLPPSRALLELTERLAD